MDQIKPEILYVVGAGRSGTTLVDILLGNVSNFESCGELNRYGKREGNPPGLESGEVFEYWSEIRKEMVSEFGEDFHKEMKELSDEFEYHKGYVKTIITKPNSKFDRYQELNKRLLEIVGSKNPGKTLIDSSKYPGRLNHLVGMGFNVKAVYIKRNPVDVVESFQKKGLEQPTKHWLLAAIYCASVGFLVNITKRRLADKIVWKKLDYNQLTQDPSKAFQSLSPIVSNEEIEKLVVTQQTNKDYKVGRLFDGNRIRLNTALKLKLSESRSKKSLKSGIIKLLNAPF
jgi:hypothetical protein